MLFLKASGQKIFDFITSSNSAATSIAIEAERSFFGHILNILRVFGSGVAIIMLTIMSLQYFAADGRNAPFVAEKKALLKGEQLKNFAIGVIVFIGASNILYFVEQFVEQILGDIF